MLALNAVQELLEDEQEQLHEHEELLLDELLELEHELELELGISFSYIMPGYFIIPSE